MKTSAKYFRLAVGA